LRTIRVIAFCNEEQGLPIAVCTGPVAPWTQLWPRFRHLD
jgi:hypothetical protein